MTKRTKMTDEALLDLLTKKEQLAGQYVWGQLGTEREVAMREYHRQPYGNEEDGWSSIVTSDIADVVEMMLPTLLKTFAATDKAVIFNPRTAKDVEGAEQATDAVSYIFFQQNNGFLILYTAIKDALTQRNCAVMWRKEELSECTNTPFNKATKDMVAMLLEDDKDAELLDVFVEEMKDQQTGQPVLGEDGQPIQLFSGRIKKTEKRNVCKVEAFSPEDLLVQQGWTSPLLSDCPYVCRMMSVTLSDLVLMGFKDVTPEELRDNEEASSGNSTRLADVTQDVGTRTTAKEISDDDSMAEGWLRMEWVLVDADGDGIAERRCIFRLRDKILKNEECSHVPIATASPILNTHRWDGQSMWDAVHDLQEVHTELLRGSLNNTYLTNAPRKTVLTDANWLPYANLEDLMDGRPGGVVRVKREGAVSDLVTPYMAGSTLPLLEYTQAMKENRTGVSRTSQGMNPDALNNTLGGRQLDVSMAAQRVELVARIFAELLLKPIMHGILKLLTDGGMEKIAFKLRDKFVEYDPMSWRDHYDMTSSVGLGTGDRIMQGQSLQMVMQSQMALMQYGLVTPQHLYHTETKIIENAGFKDVQNFVQPWQPPDPNKPKEPPLPLQIEQMKGQLAMAQAAEKAKQDDALHEREMTRDIAIENAKQEAQARDTQYTGQVTAQVNKLKAQYEQEQAMRQLEFDKFKAELTAATQIFIAKLKAESAGEAGGEMGGADSMEDGPNPAAHEAGETQSALAASMQALHTIIGTLNQPKMIIKDEAGRPIGIGPQQPQT